MFRSCTRPALVRHWDSMWDLGGNVGIGPTSPTCDEERLAVRSVGRTARSSLSSGLHTWRPKAHQAVGFSRAVSRLDREHFMLPIPALKRGPIPAGA